jgi:hypothetical protein
MKEPTLTDVLNTHFMQNMAKLHTAMPCIVTNVVGELATQRVDVQPCINVLYKDGSVEERTQLLGIPVVFPGSQTSLVSFPINVGDTVYCVFAQRSMDNFKIGMGQPTQPNDYRKMSEQDAVAFPGLVPFAKSLNNPAVRHFPHSTKDMVVSHNIGTATECEVRLTAGGDIIINTDMNVIVNSRTAQVNVQDSITISGPRMNINVQQTNWVGNITHSGNYTMTGQATFNGIPFMTHKHTGVTAGNGVSAGPIA